MRFLKKLTNPFVLVAEGFLAGAILFATSGTGLVAHDPSPPPALDSTVIHNAGR